MKSARLRALSRRRSHFILNFCVLTQNAPPRAFLLRMRFAAHRSLSQKERKKKREKKLWKILFRRTGILNVVENGFKMVSMVFHFSPQTAVARDDHENFLVVKKKFFFVIFFYFQ